MSSIKLRLLGGFHVDMDGRSMNGVLAHSPKGMQLMQYLILNRGRMETTGALTRAMWPDTDAARPESALKTLVSRMRNLLVQVDASLAACLKTVRGGYLWETQPGITVDIEEFFQLAESLQGKMEVADEEQGVNFRRMMALYKGRLLCEQEQPPWMKLRADSLHQLYLTLIEERVQKLKSAERYQEITSMCREALDADPLNQTLNMHLMDALVHDGRENEAMNQYHYTTDLISGASSAPSASGTALDAYYTRMLQADRDIQQSLATLRNEMIDGMDKPGALICDRIVFGELFRLEQRSLERQEDSHISLGVVMLSGFEEQPWQLDAAMTVLMDVMVRNLRRGDIISRMNATQVAMMLPRADADSANLVMNRLKRSFYLKYPSGCTLRFAVETIQVGRSEGA